MTMAALAERAIIIGIDGASMEIVRYMAAKGATPNLKRLMDTGAWRPMLGVFPTLTPPGLDLHLDRCVAWYP